MSKFDTKKFESLQSSFNRQYGKDGGVLISGKQTIPPVETVPFDDPVLDRLLSGNSNTGGLIKDAFIEIYGAYSSGKTTLAMEALASFSRRYPDRGTAFIDVECAFDVNYARHIGVPVDSESFTYFRPSDGKEALTILHALIETGMYSCIVLDSWAALDPPHSDKTDREIGDSQIGALAKLSSDSLREINPTLRPNGTTLIVTNQQRVNLTSMGAFGQITTGGNAVPFYAQMRLEINKVKKDSDFRKVTIVKSKGQAIPFTECVVSITHGLGLDRMASLIALAIDSKLIETGGAGWHTLKFYDGRKVQGINALIDFLKSENEAFIKLCSLVNVQPFEPRSRMAVKQSIIAVAEEDMVTD